MMRSRRSGTILTTEIFTVDDPDIVIDGQKVGKLGRRELRALCREKNIPFDPVVGKQDLLQLLMPLSREQEASRQKAASDERVANARHK